MADKTTQLIVAALGRAALAPEGLPLHGGKSASGLFPAGAAARQAARRCKDDGLVQVVHTHTQGKSVREICTLTEKGRTYLFEHTDPKPLLEDFVRALEVHNEKIDELVRQVRKDQLGLASLKEIAETVLRRLAEDARDGAAGGKNGSGTFCAQPPSGRTRQNVPDPFFPAGNWPASLLERLRQWRDAGAAEDCPLSELFHHARTLVPALTLGEFHDAVRRYYQEAKIYLHPWTGPLYELPEPALALLIGHEIVYYASLRDC